LDKIIKKTIEAINNSKAELFDIAENARNECVRLEKELEELKRRTSEIIKSVETLEVALYESKKRLMHVSRNYDKYSEEELREAYENADNIRVELAIKREREQYYIKRRNELEMRLKEAYKPLKRRTTLSPRLEFP